MNELPVVSLEAYKVQKRERWAKEVLRRVKEKLRGVHESNYEFVMNNVIDYAETMGVVYSVPGKAKQRENEKMNR